MPPFPRAIQEVIVQRLIASSLAALLAVGTLPYTAYAAGSGGGVPTATPIKHVVVIFGENISFDHYFGTYPNAANPSGEPRFLPQHGTPAVNGLTDALLYNNPNLFNTGNGSGAMNPFRLDRTEAATADQDHNYTPEQQALHFGLMDAFPEYTGTAGPPPPGAPNKGLVMGYYDGNTVTALWNYAQRFAMNDNSFDTNFGPSTPGAINLVSGQTNNVTDYANGPPIVGDGGTGNTLVGDADPVGDMCSTTTGATVQFTGNNIGTMLNAAGITWGFFQGGFDLSIVNSNGTTNCLRSTTSTVTGVTKADYIPHHQPCQYYTTTSNPTHARPTSVSTIGLTDQANHQYDISDFYAAVTAGNMPAVSFLKAPGYQDAHAGYSDPLDEQTFVVSVINFLQTTKDWDSTAVIINYDDSDGWYDHQMPTIVNQSATASDALSGTGMCGAGSSALPGPSGVAHAQGRCGYGPRLPYMVISPFAKENYVSHVMTDQTSTIRFIEDNWLGGERVGDGSFDAIAGRINDMFDFANPNPSKFILNETTGEPAHGRP
jgi:phospholipase C